MISSTEIATRQNKRRQEFLGYFQQDVADMKAAEQDVIRQGAVDLLDDPEAQTLEGMAQVASTNIVAGALASSIQAEVGELLFGIAAADGADPELLARATLETVMDVLDAAEGLSQCLATIYDAVVERLPRHEDGGFQIPAGIDPFEATNKILANVGRTELESTTPPASDFVADL